MEGHETDDAGAPVIHRVSSKISALERRAEYLEDHMGTLGESAANFARSELKAIKGGIAALTYHRAEVEGLDTAWLALQELVEAIDAPSGAVGGTGRVASAVARGRELLAEHAS